jgi:hypothetical protein
MLRIEKCRSRPAYSERVVGQPEVMARMGSARITSGLLVIQAQSQRWAAGPHLQLTNDVVEWFRRGDYRQDIKGLTSRSRFGAS